jgi:hypothetical protein
MKISHFLKSKEAIGSSATLKYPVSIYGHVIDFAYKIINIIN